MAKEYIEREALIRHLNNELEACGDACIDSQPIVYGTILGLKGAMSYANTLPAADVVEVKHGEWEIKSESIRLIDDYDEEIYIECPFCGRRYYDVSYEFDDAKILEYARKYYPYCNCGAKMDGERKERG